jgi:hypothetical protein
MQFVHCLSQICRAAIRREKVAPTAKLSTVQIPLRPVDAILAPLSPERDMFPGNKAIHKLELTYKLRVEEPGGHKPTLPMLNKSFPTSLLISPHLFVPIYLMWQGAHDCRAKGRRFDCRACTLCWQLWDLGGILRKGQILGGIPRRWKPSLPPYPLIIMSVHQANSSSKWRWDGSKLFVLAFFLLSLLGASGSKVLSDYDSLGERKLWGGGGGGGMFAQVFLGNWLGLWVLESHCQSSPSMIGRHMKEAGICSGESVEDLRSEGESLNPKPKCGGLQ